MTFRVSEEAHALIEDAQIHCGSDKDMQIAWLATGFANALHNVSGGYVRALPATGIRGPSEREIKRREVAAVLLTTEELERGG